MGNVTKILRQRDEARKAKDFTLADTLRKRIEELGFKVKDYKDHSMARSNDWKKIYRTD